MNDCVRKLRRELFLVGGIFFGGDGSVGFELPGLEFGDEGFGFIGLLFGEVGSFVGVLSEIVEFKNVAFEVLDEFPIAVSDDATWGGTEEGRG